MDEPERKNETPQSPDTAQNHPTTLTEPEQTIKIQAGQGPLDGYMEIRFDPDHRTAFAGFFPARGEQGSPITPEAIQSTYERLGITHGVLLDAAMNAAMEANLNRKIVHDVIIAQGDLPTEEIPEHIDLIPKFDPGKTKIDKNALVIDWKEISPFVMAEKGETIGTIIPAREGKTGMDVHGKDIMYPRRQVTQWELGNGLEKSEGKVLTVQEGKFEVKDRLLFMEKVLTIKGSVDYHTGHIVFPGDIHIDGFVKEGFKLYSGGSIFCKNTLDATDVNTKADLIVSGGIIGRLEGRIRVGGKLQAKFLENCHAAVKGNAEILSALVNTKMFVLGSLIMGDKAKIAGGETWAVHGVRTNQAGNPGGHRTLIKCGTDFTVQQRIDLANERLKILAVKHKKAEAIMKDRPSDKIGKMVTEIRKMQTGLIEVVSSLLNRLDADDKAMVEVRGDIFPGCTIEICRICMTVEKPQRKVRFRLEKAKGKIVMEPIKDK